MTQEATQITETPPLPGLQLVRGINEALQTLGTDFAGATDPAALAWAYAVWADTGTGTIKRRNAANTAWVTEGVLLSNNSTGRLLNVQIFTASGTYTPTPGTNSIIAEGIGGGGGGGGSALTGPSTISVGSGGNSGCYAKGRFTTAFSGGLTVTIGTGGAAGNLTTPGGAGGTSSFGSLMSMPGGGAGSGSAASGVTILAGPSSNTGGASGGNIINSAASLGGVGITLAGSNSMSGYGASSPFGAGPRGTDANNDGTDATAPGTGGSGGLSVPSSSGHIGGKGANGIVIVWEYA